MVIGAILFSLIFLASILYYIQLYDLAIRRIASCLVFMSLFSYSIIRVQSHMVIAFKRAVILVSVYFSLIAIIGLLEITAAEPVHFEAKNLVGSQRYAFIYIIGFWLLLLNSAASARHRTLNYSFLAIITCGLFLSVSRSPIVALVGSLSIFAIVRSCLGLWRPTFGKWFRLATSCAVIACLTTLIYYHFPVTIEYYGQTLFGPLLDGRVVGAVNDPGSSEGIRVVRMNEGMEYVLHNPLTGTGYLGIWSISESGGGSAYNQLLDTFIRVGILGFLFYIYLILRLVKFLARDDSPLLWGMIGVLIYGLFNETFKESQGAFVLACLFGMCSQYLRDRRTRVVVDRWPARQVHRVTVTSDQ